MKPLWVIGSGGHAKVVIDTAHASGCFEILGVLDDCEGRLGQSVMGAPVLGPATPESVRRLGVENAVIAVGPNRARAEIALRLDGHVGWITLVHPAATLSRYARVGDGSVVFAGAVVQADAVVGRHTILNTGCSVDHDSRVGDFAHLAPGARIAGDALIGVGVLLGIGCSVLPQKSVGAWSTVGGGGVVVNDIPEGVEAIGVPARQVRGSGAPGTLVGWTLSSTDANFAGPPRR